MVTNTREDFTSKYEKDPVTKCWVWKQKMFRFKIDEVVTNPRRYAFQLSGRVIPRGRNLVASCGNPKCVNPEHAKLRHSGSAVDDDQPLYLEVKNPNEMQYPPGMLATKYGVSKMDIRDARKRTLRLIVEVKQSLLTLNRMQNRFKVSIPYLKRILAISLEDFNEMKHDPNDGMYEEEIKRNPDGLKFRLD